MMRLFDVTIYRREDIYENPVTGLSEIDPEAVPYAIVRVEAEYEDGSEGYPSACSKVWDMLDGAAFDNFTVWSIRDVCDEHDSADFAIRALEDEVQFQESRLAEMQGDLDDAEEDVRTRDDAIRALNAELDRKDEVIAELAKGSALLAALATNEL